MPEMGRPRKEIDKEQFEKLCYLQCTLAEISSFFACSEDTIERWAKREYGQTFAEVYKIHSAGGKISLRRWQFKLAEHNTSMAIWLGKQLLGQRDNIDMSVEARESKEVDALNAYFEHRNTDGTTGLSD